LQQKFIFYRHIEEDIGLPDIDLSNLTDEELEFRYFM